MKFTVVMEFVAHHWPFYNESIKRGVANHFVPTNCDDGGFGKSALRPEAPRNQPRAAAAAAPA